MKLALPAVLLAAAALSGSGAGAAHPQIPVGGFPTGIAVDPVTHTVYVGNGTTNTVSLIDGSRCNSTTTTACSRHASAVTAGLDPVGIAVDPSTRTVYVANASGTLAALDGRRCRAGLTAGCRRAPPSVRVGLSPQFMAIAPATHTLYVADTNSGTVSVIDTRTCNAAARGGCGRVRATVAVGPLPFTPAVDGRTGAVYVADLGAPTVSVFDGRRCNATVTSGCRRPAVTIDVGAAPGGIVLDSTTGTVYVTGQASNDVTVIDASACNARVTSGCTRPLRVPAGAGARGIALDERTGTLYVADTAANTVSVIDASACNARVHKACRAVASAPVGISPRRVAVDESTRTVYVTNAGSDSVTILDARTCNARVHTGC